MLNYRDSENVQFDINNHIAMNNIRVGIVWNADQSAFQCEMLSSKTLQK